MTPTELEQVQAQYEELEKLCKDMALDVALIEMPLTDKKKEDLKAIVPPARVKKSWWCFAI